MTTNTLKMIFHDVICARVKELEEEHRAQRHLDHPPVPDADREAMFIEDNSARSVASATSRPARVEK